MTKKLDPKDNHKYLNLDKNGFANVLISGEHEFKELVKSWNNLPDEPRYDKRVFDALHDLVKPEYSTGDHRIPDGQKVLIEAKVADQLHQAMWASNEPKYRPIANAMVQNIRARWDGKTNDPFNGTKYTAEIKIVVATGNDKLGLYKFVIELTEIPSGQSSVIFPDLGRLGLTHIRPAMHKSIIDAWEYTGLADVYQGRWFFTNVSEFEADHSKYFQQSINPYPDHFDGQSAQAAAICTMLAASGDPYRIGIVAQEAELIDPGVAISASVPGDEDKSIASTGPKNSEGKVAKVLMKKLSDIGFKAEKLRGAKWAGLSTVYFAGKDAQNADDQKTHDENNHLGILPLKVTNVLEALDGVLLTNRYLRAYQEKIQEEWKRPWKKSTADFHLGEAEKNSQVSSGNR